MGLSPLFPSFGVSSQAWVGERTNIGEEGNKQGMTRYIEQQNVQPMSKPGTVLTPGKALRWAIPKITSLWPSAFGSLFWECPTLGLYPAHNVGPGNSIGMEIEIWWSGLRIAGEILPHVMMMWCDNWGILMMWCEQLGSYHYVECLKFKLYMSVYGHQKFLEKSAWQKLIKDQRVGVLQYPL